VGRNASTVPESSGDSMSKKQKQKEKEFDNTIIEPTLDELKQLYSRLREDYLLLIQSHKQKETLILSYRNVFRDLFENGIDGFFDIETCDDEEADISPEGLRIEGYS